MKSALRQQAFKRSHHGGVAADQRQELWTSRRKQTVDNPCDGDRF